MLKRFCILLICNLVLSYDTWCEDGLIKHLDENADHVKLVDKHLTGEIQSWHQVEYHSDTTRNAILDVLFATNEDCDLYDGVLKGTVSKNAHQYLKLPPGSYVFKAKSKSTSDILDVHFVVKEGQANEVFIDLLYFIDEQNDIRQRLKGQSKPASTTTQTVNREEPKHLASNKPGKVEKVETNTVEAGKRVAETLISNMVLLEGGSFVMGNNKASSEDEAEHTVTISPVQFNKYEVTQQQWQDIMGYNPSENKGCYSCPVENVSWEEVMKFIKKVNSIGGQKFRLPTEAEWEYVARSGGKEEIEKAGGVEEYIKKTTWYFGNSDKKTHPVGLKQPNVSGIYDLLGNVSEWCSDWYSPTYFKEEKTIKDPEGPPLGKEKVIRGGNYEDYTGDRFRPSLRGKMKPTDKSKVLGFRLVLDK